jgi:hypothetical protein
MAHHGINLPRGIHCLIIRNLEIPTATAILLSACAVQSRVSENTPPEIIAPSESVVVPDTLVSPTTTETRIASRAWSILNAAPCNLSSGVDTSSWVRYGHRGYGWLKLPKDFVLDSTFSSYHGGIRWRNSTRSVAIEHGWWGVDISEGRIQACRGTFPTGPFIVQRSSVNGSAEVWAFRADPTWRSGVRVVITGPTHDNARFSWSVLQTIAARE